MNQLQEQHTHPKDPPEDKPLAPSPLFSPWSNPAVVARMVELWTNHSANQISKMLSAEFNVRLTRNSVVGRLFRMNLTAGDKSESGLQTARSRRGARTVKSASPRPQRRPSRPKLHIVRANGNSNNLKLVQSSERDLAPLKLAAVEPLNLTLAELPELGCRYIAGNDYLYCGHLKMAGSSYCVAHHRLVWLPAMPRNQASRGIR